VVVENVFCYRICEKAARAFSSEILCVVATGYFYYIRIILFWSESPLSEMTINNINKMDSMIREGFWLGSQCVKLLRVETALQWGKMVLEIRYYRSPRAARFWGLNLGPPTVQTNVDYLFVFEKT
jgi:hypothetical protein